MFGYAKLMKHMVTKNMSVIFEDYRMYHCSAIATMSLVKKKRTWVLSLFPVL